MNVSEILEFIVEILKIISWPVVVLIIAIIFRKPIIQIIESLSYIRYKDFEAYFRRELSEIESKAQSVVLPSISDQIKQVEFNDLYQLASISPRASIMEAWIKIEKEILDAARRLSINIPYGKIPLTQIIESLISKNVINKDFEIIYHKLRDLRNKAAHASDFELDYAEAERYIKLAFRIVQKLKSIEQK